MILRVDDIEFLDSDMHPNRTFTYDEAIEELKDPANSKMWNYKWRLPTYEEMGIFSTLCKLEVGGFNKSWYWTSDNVETQRMLPKDPYAPIREYKWLYNPYNDEIARGALKDYSNMYKSYALVRPVRIQ